MNRIDARFEKLRKARKAAFIPFFTAGDPVRETTLRLLQGAEAAGADVIELGVPFSDPIADGPIIQDSYHRALQGGQTMDDVLDLVRGARARCALPIVAMISYSIVFRLGFEDFVARAVAAGVDGATVPDLPVDEATELYRPASELGFRLICFVAPSTVGARRTLVMRHAQGFIYYMAVRGITGERAELPPDLFKNLQQLRALTSVPIAVGFGISTPEQAAAVAGAADGVIVGSAIVKRMAEATRRGEDAGGAALDLIRTMSAAAKA